MRRVSLLAFGLLLTAIACEAPDPPSRRGSAGDLEPLTRYVDPFIGTGGHGHVYPGATVPFGMVQLSPDQGQGGWDWIAGYNWEDSVLVGFSHTHLSGTGIGDLLDILVMPVKEVVPINGTYRDRFDRPARSSFSHDREAASPGYYRVYLEDQDIQAELTASARVGFHRYTFPATPNPALFLDLGYAVNWDRAVETRLTVVSDTLVTGYRHSSGWAQDQKLFFAMAFSRPIRQMALADSADPMGILGPESFGGSPGPGARAGGNGGNRDGNGAERGPYRQGPATSATSSSLRALFAFDPMEAGDQLLLKVALSYVDEEGALANLEAEIPHWAFHRVREDARRSWERELRKVRVYGGTEAQRRTFYTSLYRTRLAPILFEDVDSRYRGADGTIHTAETYRKHAIYSLWDTFRAQHPLFTLIDPDRVDDLVNSMLSFYDEHGLLPVWSLVGNETNTMTGHHAIPVIADAYRKGYRGFDAERALEAMVKSAREDHRGLRFYKTYGYIPTELEVESVTKTLEYAFDDWAIASMARQMGDPDLAEEFLRRSEGWRFLFDPETRFMRGKSAEGAWAEPFDPRRSDHREGTDYTEGNAWQHSWFVPHDVAALIQVMGGEEAFLAKLDSLFELDTIVTGENVSADISGLIGQYAHGNEPSHHIAYLYNYAGAPWKTADRVREILATQYDDTPFGLSGNEDCGQMTAWYVLSALGIYPVNPAEGAWVIGSPLFPEAVVELGPGKTFTIRAHGVSAENRYIQWARLNGAPFGRSYLRHGDIAGGGVLELGMGPQPSSWGTDPGSPPPSASVPLPPTVPSAPGTRAGPPAPASPEARAASGPTLPSPEELPPDQEMAEAVKAEFLHAWNGYLTFARGHDALRPLSRGYRDWYETSLVMTPLDGFDTMLLMGLRAEAAEAKELVLQGLSFDHDFPIQIFELNIRLLGGLLSAYQMDGDPRFLELATDLADRLLPAFETATGMPYVRINLRTGEKEWPVNNPAEIGTLMLEFGALSRLTGNPVYYDVAKRAITAVFDRRSEIGLVGTTIDVETGAWQDRSSHLSGRIDSYYEYLLKSWLLFGDPDFRVMWETSVEAVNRYLADEVDDGLWYGHADMDSGQRTATRFGALDAFWPGVLALSGDLERAARRMESVYLMWTTFDVEPEQMDYSAMEVVSGGYPLRPEALESAYILYTLTGEERYKAMGWDIFQRIVRWCRTEVAYAHLEDVRTKEKSDGMQSFFLAETLKYAYLLFAPAGTLEFDEVIFNTEAHPLRRTWE
ncbi:MAG: GH92 family glycosyl hydrolase [Longimicrobiales bacterium]